MDCQVSKGGIQNPIDFLATIFLIPNPNWYRTISFKNHKKWRPKNFKWFWYLFLLFTSCFSLRLKIFVPQNLVIILFYFFLIFENFQYLSYWWEHKMCYRCAAGTLSKNSDSFWIASEMCHIILHPLQA